MVIMILNISLSAGDRWDEIMDISICNTTGSRNKYSISGV